MKKLLALLLLLPAPLFADVVPDIEVGEMVCDTAFVLDLLSCELETQKIETDGSGNLVCGTNTHTVDTNASTICTGTGEYLDSDGNCVATLVPFDSTKCVWDASPDYEWTPVIYNDSTQRLECADMITDSMGFVGSIFFTNLDGTPGGGPPGPQGGQFESSDQLKWDGSSVKVYDTGPTNSLSIGSCGVSDCSILMDGDVATAQEDLIIDNDAGQIKIQSCSTNNINCDSTAEANIVLQAGFYETGTVQIRGNLDVTGTTQVFEGGGTLSGGTGDITIDDDAFINQDLDVVQSLTAGTIYADDLLSCEVVTTDGAGQMSCDTATVDTNAGTICAAGEFLNGDGTCDVISGGGSPGGSNTQVQFNDSSAFGGDAGLVFNKTTDTLTVGSKVSIPGTTGTFDITWNSGSARWEAIGTEDYPVAIGTNSTEYIKLNTLGDNVEMVVPFVATDLTQSGSYDGPINLTPSTNITATGTACGAGCYSLTKHITEFSTVASGTCATLPASNGASIYFMAHVANNGASALTLCANASGTTTIGGASSKTLDPGAEITCFDTGSDWSCMTDNAMAYEASDSTGGTTLNGTTPVQVIIDNEIIANANYSLATNTITISAAGTYQISHQTTVDFTANLTVTRGGWESYVQVEPSGGGGYTRIQQSSAANYHRELSDYISAGRTFLYEAAAGDKLQLMMRGTNAAAAHPTVANYSFISITKVE